MKSCDSKSVNHRDSSGQTPLHVAAEQGLEDVAFHFIKKKAKLNIKDNRDWIPLHGAAYSKSYDLCERMINAKADALAITKDKNSVLSYLVRNKKATPQLLSLIEKSSSSNTINLSNIHGETPLMRACLLGDSSIVKLLLELKASCSILKYVHHWISFSGL